MERPQARIIEDQKVQTTETNIDAWEKEQLLRKYGYQSQQFSTREEGQIPQEKPLTFEEMIARDEMKKKAEEDSRKAKMMGPKPTTFDGRGGYDSEIKWGSDEDTGFGFKIEITTDMKLPKY